jgi:type II secretion system protein N
MKRVAIFAVLLAIFLVWTFPHKLVVERTLTKQLAKSNIAVQIAGVRPSLWPLGYRLKTIEFSRGEYSMVFKVLDIGVGLFGNFSVDAEACGGTLHGPDRESGDLRTVRLTFADINPAGCLRLGGITVKGTFDGTFVLTGLGRGKADGLVGRVAQAGELTIEGADGLISGHLPAPQPSKAGGKARDPQPIGEWQFARLRLDIVAEQGDIVVRSANAEAESVEWAIPKGRLASSPNGSVTIEAELKARRVDDSARSKAIVGLLPRARELDGWRTYKISGPVSAPKFLGLR